MQNLKNKIGQWLKKKQAKYELKKLNKEYKKLENAEKQQREKLIQILTQSHKLVELTNPKTGKQLEQTHYEQLSTEQLENLAQEVTSYVEANF